MKDPESQQAQQQIEVIRVSSTDCSIPSGLCSFQGETALWDTYLGTQKCLATDAFNLAATVLWQLVLSQTQRDARCDVGADALDSGKVWNDV